MKTLYVTQHFKNADEIQINLIEKDKPVLKTGECLIKIISSGINPSDALAATGYFHHANLPRIPGRDFAGIVVEGPTKWKGKAVWGTGGAAGISSDGTQAEFITLPPDDFAECPKTLDPIIAGAQPLPYVTAYYGLVKRAHIQANETVLVIGALGQVGSAAMSICHWKKCHAIALVRGKESLEKAKALGWNAIDGDEKNLAEKIKSANYGKPVNVILNSVGNIYWHELMKSLAEFGRIVTIGARDNTREVTINLFDLYRANQDLIGINSVSLDFKDNAILLNELKIGFEENQLTPLAVDENMIFSPENASEAYKIVLKGSPKRAVIKFL